MTAYEVDKKEHLRMESQIPALNSQRLSMRKRERESEKEREMHVAFRLVK